MQHSSYKNSSSNNKALLIKQKIMTPKGQWLLRVTDSEYPPETCKALWVCSWAQNPSFSWMPWSVGMYWEALLILPSPLTVPNPGLQMLAFKCETAGFFPLLQSPNHKTNISFLPEAFLCFSFQDLKHWVHNVLHWQHEPSSLVIYHVLFWIHQQLLRLLVHLLSHQASRQSINSLSCNLHSFQPRALLTLVLTLFFSSLLPTLTFFLKSRFGYVYRWYKCQRKYRLGMEV